MPDARDDVDRWLGGLKVGLRSGGVGSVTRETLERRGLRTVKNIQSVDLETARPHAGRSLAAHLHALAFGRTRARWSPSQSRKACRVNTLSGGLPRP
jgi:nucleotidyltransferase/DNA polymerase involved in DNA repair